MTEVTTETALRNAVASAEMEGLHPTESDIKLMTDFSNGIISKEEFISLALADVRNK